MRGRRTGAGRRGGPCRKTRPAIRVARRTHLCRTEATPLTCVIAQVRVKCPACTTLLALPQGTTKFKCAVCNTIAQIPAQAASSPAPAAAAGYGGAPTGNEFPHGWEECKAPTRGRAATFTLMQSEWDAFGVQKLHMGHFVVLDDGCYFKPVARQGLPQDMALMVYVSVGPQPSNVLDGVWEQELKTFISKQCKVALKAQDKHSECSKWEDHKIGISVNFNAD